MGFKITDDTLAIYLLIMVLYKKKSYCDVLRRARCGFCSLWSACISRDLFEWWVGLQYRVRETYNTYTHTLDRCDSIGTIFYHFLIVLE